jgi:DNA-binding NtrC family response regulator
MPLPVLIISEDPLHRDMLCSITSGCGFLPLGCGTRTDAQPLLLYKQFTAILYEVPEQENLHAAIKHLAHSESETPIVVVSHTDDWDSYLAAIAAGAFDCIDFPPYPKELEQILHLALNECRSSEKVIAQKA